MSGWLDSGWLDQRQIKQRTKKMKLLDVLKRYDRKLMEESSKLVKKYKSLLKEEDLCDGGVCEDTYEDDFNEADYSDEEAAKAAANAASTAAAAAAKAAKAPAVTPGPDFDQEKFEKDFGKALDEEDVDECDNSVSKNDDLLSEAKKSKKSSKKPAAKKSSKAAKKPAKKEDNAEDKDEVDVDLSMDDFFTEDNDLAEDDMLKNRPHNNHHDDPAGVVSEGEKECKDGECKSEGEECKKECAESEDDFDPEFNPDNDEEVEDDERKFAPTTGMHDTTPLEMAAQNAAQNAGDSATEFEPDPEDHDEIEAKATDKFGFNKDKERDDMVDHFRRFSVRDEGSAFDDDLDDMYDESEKYLPGVDPNTLLPSEKRRLRDTFRDSQEDKNAFRDDGLPLDDEYEMSTRGPSKYDPDINPRADEYLGEKEEEPSAAKFFSEEDVEEATEEDMSESKAETEPAKAEPVNDPEGLMPAKDFFSDDMTTPAIDPEKKGKKPEAPKPAPKKDDKEDEDLEESDLDDMVDEANESEEDFMNESLKAYRRKNYRLFD